MYYLLLYLSGVVVCNVLLDVVCLVMIAKVVPTWWGLLLLIFKCKSLKLDPFFRVWNIIGAIVFSWLLAIIVVLKFVSIKYYRERSFKEDF